MCAGCITDEAFSVTDAWMDVNGPCSLSEVFSMNLDYFRCPKTRKEKKNPTLSFYQAILKMMNCLDLS